MGDDRCPLSDPAGDLLVRPLAGGDLLHHGPIPVGVGVLPRLAVYAQEQQRQSECLRLLPSGSG